ncbi:hypothetical protein COBT_000187 [Conglomerata obtusa]
MLKLLLCFTSCIYSTSFASPFNDANIYVLTNFCPVNKEHVTKLNAYICNYILETEYESIHKNVVNTYKAMQRPQTCFGWLDATSQVLSEMFRANFNTVCNVRLHIKYLYEINNATISLVADKITQNVYKYIKFMESGQCIEFKKVLKCALDIYIDCLKLLHNDAKAFDFVLFEMYARLNFEKYHMPQNLFVDDNTIKNYIIKSSLSYDGDDSLKKTCGDIFSSVNKELSRLNIILFMFDDAFLNETSQPTENNTKKDVAITNSEDLSNFTNYVNSDLIYSFRFMIFKKDTNYKNNNAKTEQIGHFNKNLNKDESRTIENFINHVIPDFINKFFSNFIKCKKREKPLKDYAIIEKKNVNRVANETNDFKIHNINYFSSTANICQLILHNINYIKIDMVEYTTYASKNKLEGILNQNFNTICNFLFLDNDIVEKIKSSDLLKNYHTKALDYCITKKYLKKNEDKTNFSLPKIIKIISLVNALFLEEIFLINDQKQKFTELLMLNQIKNAFHISTSELNNIASTINCNNWEVYETKEDSFFDVINNLLKDLKKNSNYFLINFNFIAYFCKMYLNTQKSNNKVTCQMLLENMKKTFEEKKNLTSLKDTIDSNNNISIKLVINNYKEGLIETDLYQSGKEKAVFSKLYDDIYECFMEYVSIKWGLLTLNKHTSPYQLDVFSIQKANTIYEVKNDIPAPSDNFDYNKNQNYIHSTSILAQRNKPKQGKSQLPTGPVIEKKLHCMMQDTNQNTATNITSQENKNFGTSKTTFTPKKWQQTQTTNQQKDITLFHFLDDTHKKRFSHNENNDTTFPTSDNDNNSLDPNYEQNGSIAIDKVFGHAKEYNRAIIETLANLNKEHNKNTLVPNKKLTIERQHKNLGLNTECKTMPKTSNTSQLHNSINSDKNIEKELEIQTLIKNSNLHDNLIPDANKVKEQINGQRINNEHVSEVIATGHQSTSEKSINDKQTNSFDGETLFIEELYSNNNKMHNSRNNDRYSFQKDGIFYSMTSSTPIYQNQFPKQNIQKTKNQRKIKSKTQNDTKLDVKSQSPNISNRNNSENIQKLKSSNEKYIAFDTFLQQHLNNTLDKNLQKNVQKNQEEYGNKINAKKTVHDSSRNKYTNNYDNKMHINYDTVPKQHGNIHVDEHSLVTLSKISNSKLSENDFSKKLPNTYQNVEKKVYGSHEQSRDSSVNNNEDSGIGQTLRKNEITQKDYTFTENFDSFMFNKNQEQFYNNNSNIFQNNISMTNNDGSANNFKSFGSDAIRNEMLCDKYKINQTNFQTGANFMQRTDNTSSHYRHFNSSIDYNKRNHSGQHQRIYNSDVYCQQQNTNTNNDFQSHSKSNDSANDSYYNQYNFPKSSFYPTENNLHQSTRTNISQQNIGAMTHQEYYNAPAQQYTGAMTRQQYFYGIKQQHDDALLQQQYLNAIEQQHSEKLFNQRRMDVMRNLQHRDALLRQQYFDAIAQQEYNEMILNQQYYDAISYQKHMGIMPNLYPYNAISQQQFNGARKRQQHIENLFNQNHYSTNINQEQMIANAQGNMGPMLNQQYRDKSVQQQLYETSQHQEHNNAKIRQHHFAASPNQNNKDDFEFPLVSNFEFNEKSLKGIKCQNINTKTLQSNSCLYKTNVTVNEKKEQAAANNVKNWIPCNTQLDSKNVIGNKLLMDAKLNMDTTLVENFEVSLHDSIKDTNNINSTNLLSEDSETRSLIRKQIQYDNETNSTKNRHAIDIQKTETYNKAEQNTGQQEIRVSKYEADQKSKIKNELPCNRSLDITVKDLFVNQHKKTYKNDVIGKFYSSEVYYKILHFKDVLHNKNKNDNSNFVLTFCESFAELKLSCNDFIMLYKTPSMFKKLYIKCFIDYVKEFFDEKKNTKLSSFNKNKKSEKAAIIANANKISILTPIALDFEIEANFPNTSLIIKSLNEIEIYLKNIFFKDKFSEMTLENLIDLVRSHFDKNKFIITSQDIDYLKERTLLIELETKKIDGATHKFSSVFYRILKENESSNSCLIDEIEEYIHNKM